MSREGPPPSLQGLPNELVHMVAAELQPRELAQLCRVNKYFTATWTRYLYQSLRGRDEVSGRAYLGQIKAYAMKADVRPFLTSVSLHAGRRARLQPLPGAAWCAHMDRALRHVVNPLTPAQRLDLMNEAANGDLDAIGAAVLHICHAVRRVHLTFLPGASFGLINCGRFIHRSLHPFYNRGINHLELLHDPCSDSWQEWHSWSSITRSPRLRHLRLENFWFNQHAPGQVPLIPCPTLSHFKVFESNLQTNSLLQIAVASPKMSELCVRNIDASMFGAVEFNKFSPWRYRYILGAVPGLQYPRMGSLRKLTLLSPLETDDFPESRNHTLNFRNFPYLADLTISDWLLFDRPRHDGVAVSLPAVLPSALQKLKIFPSEIRKISWMATDDYEACEGRLYAYIEAELDGLVQERHEYAHFPDLQLVVAPRATYLETAFEKKEEDEEEGGMETEEDGLYYSADHARSDEDVPEGHVPPIGKVEWSWLPRGFAWKTAGYVPTDHEQLWLDSVEPFDTYDKCVRYFWNHSRISLMEIMEDRI